MAVTQLLDLDAATYEPHPVHRSDRVWSETNCYMDLWVEVLHALGLDPLAAGGFAVATDFEVDQWTLFKPPPEDLRTLYGIEVSEINIWRPVLDHAVDQVDAGRTVTVDVDAFYLPDTAGVSYRIQHTKTTIMPNLLDVDGRRLGYFHNASYFELSGDDFDGLFQRAGEPIAEVLLPYVETVRLERIHHKPVDELVEVARGLLRRYIASMPRNNPMERMYARVTADLDWLRSSGIDVFHAWAFGTLRQCGASAELSAGHLQWLADHDVDTVRLHRAAESLLEVARGCKSLEFSIARLARGRTVDIEPAFASLARHWEDARAALVEHHAA